MLIHVYKQFTGVKAKVVAEGRKRNLMKERKKSGIVERCDDVNKGKQTFSH